MVGLLYHFFRAVGLRRVLGKASSIGLTTVGSASSREAKELRARITEGGGVVHIFCFPQCRRGINPYLVESLTPHLGAVCSTHPRDLGPEGFLGLGYPHVVAFLFGLVFGLLSIF